MVAEGHPFPGGEDFGVGASVFATLGAGSPAVVDDDAVVFFGGPLGDAGVPTAGGALNGRLDLALGWSAAPAGSGGGSGFDIACFPASLFGNGGGLFFGDCAGDAMGEVPTLTLDTGGKLGGTFMPMLVPWSLVSGLRNCPTVSPMS